MPPAPPTRDYAREFKKTLEGFHHNRNLRAVFTDWLEIAACAIHQEPYHAGLVRKDEAFEQVEAQYMAAVKKYTREELDAFAKLLGITKLALWEGKTDFLGQLYMELEISNDRNSEFFTPFPVALMMAKMTFGDVSGQIKEKGFITVGEPACGGGAMLIAAAQVIEEQGFDPGAVMFFDATDISKPCCNMAYLQTSILGLSGIVRHGNSLSREQWGQWITPICRLFPARTNAMVKSLLPEQTSEAIKPTEDTPPPAYVPAPEPEPLRGRPEGQAQQTALFSFLAETQDQNPTTAPVPPTKPKEAQKPPVEAAALEQLAKEGDNYQQGRLF